MAIPNRVTLSTLPRRWNSEVKAALKQSDVRFGSNSRLTRAGSKSGHVRYALQAEVISEPGGYATGRWTGSTRSGSFRPRCAHIPALVPCTRPSLGHGRARPPSPTPTINFARRR